MVSVSIKIHLQTLQIPTLKLILILSYHLQLSLPRVLSPSGFPTNMHEFLTRLLEPKVYNAPMASPFNQQH